jgi:hypothetical protein
LLGHLVPLRDSGIDLPDATGLFAGGGTDVARHVGCTLHRRHHVTHGFPCIGHRLCASAGFATLALMSRRMCFAALAERPARWRPCAATTEQPRPCSPARATFTATLSARMSAWDAMSPVISAIFRNKALRSSTVVTTCGSVSPF